MTTHQPSSPPPARKDGSFRRYYSELEALDTRMNNVSENPLDALRALADMMEFTNDECEWQRPQLIRDAVSALERNGHGTVTQLR